jgi:acetylornithine/N-succinyldiaminopimelate aminotransferase
VVAKAHVAEVMVPGTHGSTYGGNPVAAAGACAVYDELLHHGAMARGRIGAERLVRGLESIRAHTGERIRDIRHRGMWVGLTFADDRAGRVLALARDRGLLVNAIGERTMRFAPSLLITDREIDDGLARFADALTAADA